MTEITLVAHDRVENQSRFLNDVGESADKNHTCCRRGEYEPLLKVL